MKVKKYATFFVGYLTYDWVCTVSEDEGRLVIEGRWRFYDQTPRTDHVWDGCDRKEWFAIKDAPQTPPAAIALARELMDLAVLAGAAVRAYPMVVDCVVVESGDLDLMIEGLKRRPWCHMKSFATKEEADRFIAARKPS